MPLMPLISPVEFEFGNTEIVEKPVLEAEVATSIAAGGPSTACELGPSAGRPGVIVTTLALNTSQWG